MAKILSDILFLATAVAAPFVVLDLIIKVVSKNKKRPSEITTLVLIFLFGFIVFVLRLILNLISRTNLADPIHIISAFLTIIWAYGIWNMKRWGVIGYTSVFLILQIVSYLEHQFSLLSLIFIFPIGLLFYFFPRMK